MHVYRPTRAWLVANALGAAVLPVGGGFALANAAAHADALTAGDWFWIAVVGAVIGFGSVWLVRVFCVRVIYDAVEVRLHNLFRVLRIPRNGITYVDDDPRTAGIEWSTPEGRERTATISAVAVGTHYILPVSTLKTPRAFLLRLRRWAG